jgi:hypothetical protein
MALTTIDFNTTFNYVPATKVFSFVDTVDYSGQSVAIANATGVIKVVAPSGTTIYNNTNHGSPDIDPSVSRTNTTTVPLPLDSNGDVMQGLYQVTYTVRIVDNTLASSYDVALTKSITIAYESPTVDLDMEVDCVTPILSSVDNTSYTQNLITPTITRVHKIYYPASIALSPISGTGATVSTSTFYVVNNQALQYSSTLTSTLSYSLGSGFYISDEVAGNGYLDVLCDSSLCDIYCGLRSQYNRWVNAKGNIPVQAEEQRKLNLMMDLASLAKIAIDCGKNTQVTEYITAIKTIGNFDGGCGCSDGTPTLVTGLGSAGTIVVQAGNGTTVTSATGGNTTTYTVSLEASLLTKLNNAYNTVVSAGSGISIAVATATDGTKTYTVTNTQLQPNSLDQIFSITLASGSLPVIASESSLVTGTTLKASTLAADNDGSVSDWQVNNSFFTINDFFSSSASAYYPDVEIIYSLKTGFSLTPYARPYNVDIVSYSATEFKMRFVDTTTGQVVSGATVDAAYSTIKLKIKINS